jgi:hypothetical protein
MKPLITLLLAFCFSATLVADDLRTWTDSSGAFTIEAKFISIEGNKVLLEKADGSRIQIELSKLKAEDRSFAMRENTKKMTDNPFKKSEENPFKNSSKNRRRNENNEASANATPLTDINWTAAKQLTIFGSDWKPPAVSNVDLKLNWHPRPLTIPCKDFFDNCAGIVVPKNQKQAVLITSLERPGDRAGSRGSVYVCNLETGTVKKEFTVSGKNIPLAISPDGSLLLTREEVWGVHQHFTLTLWSLSDTELTPLHRFEAAQKEGHGRDIKWATFVTKDLFITWQNDGMLTWWDSSDVKPIQQLKLNGNCKPALSHDGKVLAVISQRDLVLLDALTGDTLSVKTGLDGMFTDLAFSPDGKKIAVASHSNVDVYQLDEANQTSSIGISGLHHDSQLFWTSPEALMAGHPLCFLSPATHVNVWSYNGGEKCAALGDHALFLVKNHQNKTFTLVPSRMPAQAALDTLAQAQRDPRFYVLKPGTPVSIDASGISDPQMKQDAIDGLTRQLEAAGHKVGSGNVTLVASLTSSKEHEISYNTFGRPFDRGRTYKVPGWTYSLKIVADGKTHWMTGAGNHPPMMISLKQDETIEDHLKQYGKPSAGFFQHVQLPKYVARAQSDQQTGSQSLRQSQVTTQGIR